MEITFRTKAVFEDHEMSVDERHALAVRLVEEMNYKQVKAMLIEAGGEELLLEIAKTTK